MRFDLLYAVRTSPIFGVGQRERHLHPFSSAAVRTGNLADCLLELSPSRIVGRLTARSINAVECGSNVDKATANVEKLAIEDVKCS